ncbi:phosphatidylinositol-glycan biosynthesis class S protein-domain-containing protein [Pisolithus marmoratus]|nr:phosphatidylinositol-glycan biosynthesis class S protein-domain-containing protein [Pisolithus marmoratus]
MDASHGFKDPRTLSFQRPIIRRLILGSYWVVILFAIPFWWRLTSIERIALPSSRVHAQLEKRPVFPVNVRLDGSSFQGRAPVLASELNDLLAQSTRTSAGWSNLDIHVTVDRNAAVDNQTARGVYTVALGDTTVVRHPRHLVLSQHDGSSAAKIVDVLTGLLAPEAPSRVQRVAQYAKRYRLAFTLLNEDVTSDQLIYNWDIRAALADHISPVLARLNVLHDFVIESQVQFHAPLAFEPVQIVSENSTFYGLTPGDLTIFVNSAEWTLSSSVSEDPVIHFLLFVPSPSRQPLHILDTQGSPTRRAVFLLPQWGGIYILNHLEHVGTRTRLTAVDLSPAFSAFANQLSALLGVSDLPRGVRSEDPSILSDWQLDTVLRYRALENIVGTQQTLHSIVKLVDQIENMPVDETVRGDVQNALTALEQAYQSTAGPPLTILQWSREALSLASHAFFNPGMLALLYFPAEHKYAVYTPLFASIAVPLIVALGRELHVWRREHRTTTSN